MIVEFFNDDDLQTDLDPDLFEIVSDPAVSQNFFKVKYPGKVGEYPIRYRVYFDEYPDLVYE